jgi:hypothetical protein
LHPPPTPPAPPADPKLLAAQARAQTDPPNNVPFKPFGELKLATFPPTQQIRNLAADAATALGMQPYTANDLAKRIGNVLGLTPLGVAGSALDLIDAKHRGDLPGAVTAAAGMIPGAKGVAGVVDAGAASVLDKLIRYCSIRITSVVAQRQNGSNKHLASPGKM